MENLYIQSTLTAQQAFEAMQAGKNVVCKAFGNTYDTLDNFPATVFFKPDYEFALALQTIALNGIKFTTPLTLPELEDNQDLFIVSASSIKKMQFKGQIEVLTAVKNGFAQRDEDNAKNHLKAICLSFGVTDPSIIIEGVFVEPKKSSRKKAEKTEVAEKDLFTKISTKINACESVQDVKDVRTDFRVNAELTEHEHELLETHCAQKIAEFEAPVEEKEPTEAEYYAEPEPVATQSIDDELDDLIPVDKNYAFNKVKGLIQNAQSDADLGLASNEILSNQRHLSSENLDELQADYKNREDLIKTKADLINRASEAPNATEANALITYTKTWNESDRKPVLDAINARLLVLNKPQLEQQSLAVRIQNAESYEELDSLRAEVEDRDPLIQERLFGLIKDREISLTF